MPTILISVSVSSVSRLRNRSRTKNYSPPITHDLCSCKLCISLKDKLVIHGLKLVCLIAVYFFEIKMGHSPWILVKSNALYLFWKLGCTFVMKACQLMCVCVFFLKRVVIHFTSKIGPIWNALQKKGQKTNLVRQTIWKYDYPSNKWSNRRLKGQE